MTEEKKEYGSVKRSFYYYNLELMKINESNNSMVIPDNSKECYYKMFKKIQKWQGNPKYSEKIKLSTVDNDKIYIIVDTVIPGRPIEFRIVLCRNDALPYVEENGILKFLTEFLPRKFSLAEITHCVIFPESSLLGAEYNFQGARASVLCEYLPKITKEIDFMTCKGKLNQDVLKKLMDGESYSLFSLSIRNNSKAMSYLMEQSSIFFLPFRNISNVDVFEISFKRRKTKKKDGFEEPMSKNQIQELITNYREDIKSFKISQGSIRGDCIDLLSDKFVKSCEVIKTEKRTVDSKAAYREIKTFFDTNVRKYCEPV